MNISLHIKALLFRHDCVIVPGFGAFLAQFQSAKIDVAENLIYPPKRSIHFNAQLQNNDGLLLNYLESIAGLNYVEAQNAIKDFVEDVEATLANQEKVVFKDLGSFTLQNESKLVFEPFETNFLVDAFGLEGLHQTPVSRAIEQKPKEETKVVAISSAKTTSRPYLKYAAVGLIAFGLAGVFGYSWYTNDVKKHNLQVQNDAQEKVHSKIQNAEFSIIEPLPSLQIKREIPLEEKNIHIVGGAFREEANAQKKLIQLKDLGFDAHLVGKNKYGLHQVAYSSFSDADEAKLALKQIKQKYLSSAWLLVQ